MRVLKPFRVVHEGKPYSDGDEVTVPVSVADVWLRLMFVERVISKQKY